MNGRPILVTGGTGQVAIALEAAAHVRLIRVGRPDFDFDKPETVVEVLHRTSPWLVVNAAAYTAVDAAEANQEVAFRANRDGPRLLARLCTAADIPLLHISTDYVYDGRKGEPYTEHDPVAPQTVYGASKLAGDEAVLKSGARAVILRTSWVYSPIGKNFVRTMLALGKSRDQLTVVADQRGCPTAAADLAGAILKIADRLSTGWKDSYAGVFNAAGSGETTWYGLASAVFEEAARHGMKVPTVSPITAAEWPTPAKRPGDSRLNCSRLNDVFGIRLPQWYDSVASTVGAILANPT